MNSQWVTKPIVSQGHAISRGLDWYRPLLPDREEIAYKIRLVMKSMEMIACEGRQSSLEEIDLMESYEKRIGNSALDEDSLREMIEEFGVDFRHQLQGDPIKVDPRALLWAARS